MITAYRKPALIALVLALCLGPAGSGAYAAKPRSTLERTIVRSFAPQDPGYGELARAPGEPYVVHPGAGIGALEDRNVELLLPDPARLR